MIYIGMSLFLSLNRCENSNIKATKEQMKKFRSAIFQKYFNQTVSYWEFKEQIANSVDPDEAAHKELPHLDLYCLQIQLWGFKQVEVREGRINQCI